MPVDIRDGMSLSGRRSPRVTVFHDDRAVAKALARRVADLVTAKPRLVLGLPTGRTPLALYRELAAGKSPDAALHAAKLELVHSKGNLRKPYYWAPFQLYTVAP